MNRLIKFIFYENVISGFDLFIIIWTGHPWFSIGEQKLRPQWVIDNCVRGGDFFVYAAPYAFWDRDEFYILWWRLKKAPFFPLAWGLSRV